MIHNMYLLEFIANLSTSKYIQYISLASTKQ